MKTLLMAVSLVWAGANAALAATTNDQLKAETIRRAQDNLVVVEPEKQNEIKAGDITYCGIAVAAVQADNRLQLLNPVAPGEYGTVEDSVVRDSATGAATGLKIFSIKF
jgi:hypothetical protein